MASVSFRNIEKSFGKIKIIHGISFDISDGEFVVLVGPSGCGKSTLLRMLAGLEEISGGEIAIDDKVINDLDSKDRDIAMVFQNYALYPHMTVRDNMAFGLKLRRYSKKEIAQRIEEATKILHLEELLDRRPKALSGGQRQRVAVGRAIVRKPAVFLFDEPLSNLDAKLRIQMRVEISQLHSQLDATMIYVTHDQTEAMTTVDVNTGGYVGHRNLEETIYKTNLEAAQSIARQLRLRNLGGIIIIDFIDMDDEEHKRQVLRTLEQALERDHTKTTVSELSELGLVEMTRKRTTESLGRRLCEPCGTCNGKGIIKTVETVTYEIFREIMRSGRQFEATKLLVMASPAVVDRILEDQSTTVADLEELIGRSIRFKREDQYSQEQFDVVLL